ncbi:hypothetical protein DFH07DRAFT_754988 [Mycena maculata]|uniref:Uncharacterized protein n=1 Tax=Mycena maculata TaxID=230809 RepID=A0AAD7I2Y5_9AGAR|nr:hypothetical protein DFH07DRAFT_754988 [Mycena maculata]
MVQDLKVNERDPPALHKDLVKCVNKYGMSFEAVCPSTQIKKEMPLWYHPGADHRKRQLNNGEKADCMQKNHSVQTVGDGLNLTRRLDDPEHENLDSCECNDCEEDRTVYDCENPHSCAAAAASRLRQILPEWLPTPGADETPVPEDDTDRLPPTKSISSLAQGLRMMTKRADEPKVRPDPVVR